MTQMNQTRRRVPPVPGVRDVLTAMDFVLAAVGKKANPDFVAFREEIEKLVAECDEAIAKAGKAEDIEALHAAATANRDDAARELAQAYDKSAATIEAAKDKAQKVLDAADNAIAARSVGLDAREKELSENQALLDRKDAEWKDALDKRAKAVAESEAQIKEAQDEVTRRRKSVSARESKLDEAQKKIAAQRARLKAAGFRDAEEG